VTGLGLSEIISQQQAEQDRIRGKAEKKSLKEIQDEEAFDKWWQEESLRTQSAVTAPETSNRGKKYSVKGKRGSSKPLWPVTYS